MYENSGLGNLRLLEVLCAASEHHVRYPPAKDLIGLFKQIMGKSLVFIEILTHSGKLGTLARKNKCFHLCLIYLRF